MYLQLSVAVIGSLLTLSAFASDDEERLMMDVFRGYNSLIQPVKNISDTPIIVKIALQLVLLINVVRRKRSSDAYERVVNIGMWLTHDMINDLAASD
ncbi:hypothetical protein OSTOST_25541 [Ostertagia ostertagi]